MKKVVVIMLMSLLFLATFAQRPSKSRSTEVDNNGRNKSEVTINRSHENTSRSNDDPVTMNDDRSKSNNPNNNNYSNRSADDKIVNKKTEVHQNIESRSGYNANSGRDRSINSRTYEVERRNYNTPDRNRSHHDVYEVHKPKPIEYRRIYHPYHAPVHVHVIWTPAMYNEYMRIYPEFRYWYYPSGYRIHTISAYDAMYYVGDLVNVYGRIYDTWYSRETDEYFLYFGAGYPYQDFTVIIPGHKARQFSRRPEIFFEGRYIWVTGLVSVYHGQPEMVVKRKHQIHLY